MDIITNLFVVAVIVVWMAVVYWTRDDARRRIEDHFMVNCAAVGAVLFPFVGSLVYMIIRPPEYLEDVRERELEIAAAEAKLGITGGLCCPHCDAVVEKDFVRCPACLRRLREPCGACKRPLDAEWRICPYCESEPGQAAAPARPARRQRAPAKQTKRQKTAETAAVAKPSSPERVRSETPEAPAVEAPEAPVVETPVLDGSAVEAEVLDN